MREIVTNIEGAIGNIQINRPALHNALSPRMMAEIEEHVTRLGRTEGVSAVMMSGVGDKAFSVGCDIGILRSMSADEISSLMRVGARCMAAIEMCPKPVIALVNGYALGGGFELVLACDLAIAAEHASFGFPEVTLGIIPGFGGTQRLPRRVGNARAKDIIYTGRNIDAGTALTWGIVNRVVPGEQLLDAARELTQALDQSDERALGAAKRALNSGIEGPFKEGLLFETNEFLDCFIHSSVRERLSRHLNRHQI